MILRFAAHLLTLILLVAGHQAYSQTKPDVFWGPHLEDQKGVTNIAVFGTDDSNFYTLQKSRRKRDGYTISKIDVDSLNVIGNASFVFPDINDLEPSFQRVISLKGNNYLITTTNNTTLGKVFIYAFRVNEDASISADPVLLAAASTEALNNGGNFRTYVDKDKIHLTVIVPTEHLNGRNEKFKLRLFNPELKLLRAKKLEIPYATERLSYVDAAIDSSGNVFVLASIKNLTLESLNKDRNIGKDFSLLHYDWETESLNEKSLSLGLKWLYDVKLFVNQRGNIQICGYYSNMVDLIMAGTFSVEIQPTSGDVLNRGISPFDREFRAELRPASHSTTEVDAFELDFVFASDSGNTILISEKKYTETTQNFNPATGSYSTIYIYNFDEILVSSIDASSKIDYNLVIPKFQSSSSKNSSYTSFLAESHHGSVFLFYNDHERNAALSIEKSRGYRQLTSATNSQLVMLEIDAAGQVTKTPLFTATSMRAAFIPGFVYKTSSGIILMAKSGYRTQYFKVKLD